MKGPHPNLVYAGKFAWKALEALTIPNFNRRDRMVSALRHILLVPMEGMPIPILKKLQSFNDTFLTEGPDRRMSEGLIEYNVRKMRSWKKREKAIDDLMWLSVGIIEAGAVYLGCSGWLEEKTS